MLSLLKYFSDFKNYTPITLITEMFHFNYIWNKKDFPIRPIYIYVNVYIHTCVYIHAPIGYTCILSLSLLFMFWFWKEKNVWLIFMKYPKNNLLGIEFISLFTNAKLSKVSSTFGACLDIWTLAGTHRWNSTYKTYQTWT